MSPLRDQKLRSLLTCTRPRPARWLASAALAASALILGGCLPDDPPDVLATAPEGPSGPAVIFNMEATPLPDVPFPNDLLTRPDPQATTGLRLNLSVQAPTARGRNLRRGLTGLDGFGLWAPITVRFSDPLDVAALAGAGRSYEADPVRVIDLTEGDTFGEQIPLDLGRGHFPLITHDPDAYFERDARAGESNLLLETVDEDLDGDGILDPLEDTDGDEVLDVPNVYPAGGDPVDDLLTFYEVQTNTLILRPLLPLRPGHTYAVVLTDQVRGLDGRPVRSPFPYIHHARQYASLRALPEALKAHDLTLGEVAFTWAFTTQTALRDLQDIRHGLNGQGVFQDLADAFPSAITAVSVLKDAGAEEPLLLRADDLRTLIDAAGEIVLGGSTEERAGIRASLSTVDYMISARFSTPDLLVDEPEVDEDGLLVTHPEGDFAPASTFRLDRPSMQVEAGDETVPMWCAVPVATEDHQPPFDVVLYGHSLGGTGFELIRVAGPLTAQGLAVCAIDAFGHGRLWSAAERASLQATLYIRGLGALIDVLEGSRARDVNNDGVVDPGLGVFTADPFRTRDVLRQGAVDWLQALRVLRGFDGFKSWAPAQGGGAGELAGDFNGDGVVDFGGPAVSYTLTGQGFGAMIATLTGAVAPEIQATALISGGGGLTDIGARTTEAQILGGVIAHLLGPLIVGEPPESNFTALRFLIPGEDTPRAPFARLPPLVAGDVIYLINERSGRRQRAQVDAEGGFSVSVAADAVIPQRIPAALRRVRKVRRLDDAPPYTLEDSEVTTFGDPLAIEVYDRDGALKHRVDTLENVVAHNGLIYPVGSPLVAIEGGMGLRRQSPSLRRFLQIYQTAVEPGDPINYARLHALEPRELITPQPIPDPPAAALTPTEGSTANSPLLVVATAGDPVVPVSSALSLARAAGLLPLDVSLPDYNGRSPEAVYIDHRVTEGVARLDRYEGGGLFDVDDLSEGADGLGAPRLDPPLRWTIDLPAGAESGVRVPLLESGGRHGISAPRPDRAWDGPTAVLELIGRFFTEGQIEP